MAMSDHSVQYGTAEIQYDLIYAQRKTLGITVHPEDLRVVVKVGLTVDIAQAHVKLTITEGDLLAGSSVTPVLIIDNNDVNVSVVNVGSDLQCWGGELFQLLSFGTAESILANIIHSRLEDYFEGIDVTDYLGLIPVPPPDPSMVSRSSIQPSSIQST